MRLFWFLDVYEKDIMDTMFSDQLGFFFIIEGHSHFLLTTFDFKNISFEKIPRTVNLTRKWNDCSNIFTIEIPNTPYDYSTKNDLNKSVADFKVYSLFLNKCL